MNFFVWSGLYSFIANLLIAVFVYTRNHKHKANILYVLFSLSVSGWSFGSFLVNVVPEEANALFVLRFNYLFAVWLPSFYIHFVYALTQASTPTGKMKLRLSYGLSLLLSPLVFTSYFIPALRMISGTEFRISVPGPLYYVFFAFFGIAMLEVILHTWVRVNTFQGNQKKQMVFITIANAIAIFAGFEYFSRVFGFIDSPPLDDYILVSYLLVVAYSIVRHRLMDIEVIVKKTIVFAGLFSVFLFVFLSVTYVLNLMLSSYMGFNKNIATILAFAVGIIAYKPTEAFLINMTDRYLFQKKYDYRRLLKDASRGMSRIESLDRLLGLVVHFITMKMRVKNAAVLVQDHEDGKFKLAHQRGYQKMFLDYELDSSNPLIRYLAREKEALDTEHIREYIHAGNRKNVRGEEPHEYDFPALLAIMEELNAACCVPSFLGRELRNIVVIGDKKSGDDYTDDDLNVLFTLAQESAIAIENARLYDEAVNKTQELAHINEQLEYSKSLLMKALSETEVANKQLQDTHAQLVHEQKMATLGRLAASVGHEVNNPLTILSMNVSRAILKLRKNPDLKVSEITDLFDKMEQNIGRIKAVVNTLTGLLKRSEKGKFEPLSLKLILEETLPLVQFQTYLDNLTGTEVEFDVPSNIPLVRGDLERLQEVFLNLFINAYHAMSGKRNRRIYVKAEIQQDSPKLVFIHFQDNGSGISEENAKKIFNYGFTTKPPGKGSGLGLYMCKYIIELHGGSMEVRSELGRGTTFTLTLPIYEEASTASGSQMGGASL